MPNMRNAVAPPRVTVNVQLAFAQTEPGCRIIIHTNTHADTTCDGTTTDNGGSGANAMASDCAYCHPPIILAGGHRDRGNLAAVAPFTKEGHSKGLHPCWAQNEREEIANANHQIIETAYREGRGAPG